MKNKVKNEKWRDGASGNTTMIKIVSRVCDEHYTLHMHTLSASSAYILHCLLIKSKGCVLFNVVNCVK